MGGYKVCEHFEKEFSTHRGEISPDGEVTVEFVECLASCGTAPVAMIDDELHTNLDAAKVKQLAEQIRAQAKQRK
jgi:NADH-quinone oxidoreductase subunit E